MKRLLNIVLLLAGYCFTPPVMQAQIGESSLAGLVNDPTGAVVSGAQISLYGADGSVIRTAQSRIDGTYLIPTLLPGRYRLTRNCSDLRRH
jgi:hypothetical protein